MSSQEVFGDEWTLGFLTSRVFLVREIIIFAVPLFSKIVFLNFLFFLAVDMDG